jgi:hypothetical protein
VAKTFFSNLLLLSRVITFDAIYEGVMSYALVQHRVDTCLIGDMASRRRESR